MLAYLLFFLDGGTAGPLPLWFLVCDSPTVVGPRLGGRFAMVGMRLLCAGEFDLERG